MLPINFQLFDQKLPVLHVLPRRRQVHILIRQEVVVALEDGWLILRSLADLSQAPVIDNQAAGGHELGPSESLQKLCIATHLEIFANT